MKKLLALILTVLWLTGCSATSKTEMTEENRNSERKEQVTESVYDLTTKTQKGTKKKLQATASADESTTTSKQTEERKSTSSSVQTSSRVTYPTTAQSIDCITREEAKRIALERFGLEEKEISRYEINLDYDDDARRWEYEIGFYVGTTEYDVEIDAKSGKVLWTERETEPERKSTVTTANRETISKEKAKSIALKRAAVAEADISRFEIDLDYDDDTHRWTYEISFYVGRVEYDITVDGITGSVLEFEKEVD